MISAADSQQAHGPVQPEFAFYLNGLQLTDVKIRRGEVPDLVCRCLLERYTDPSRPVFPAPAKLGVALIKADREVQSPRVGDLCTFLIYASRSSGNMWCRSSQS